MFVLVFETVSNIKEVAVVQGHQIIFYRPVGVDKGQK